MASVSEEELYRGGNPIDELRRTVNTSQFTPEQASANRNAFADEAAYFAPVTGEALSARDAWDASGQGGQALSEGRYGDAAGHYVNMLTGTLGAIPLAGTLARGSKRAAQWMDDNLHPVVNAMTDLMPKDPASQTNIFAGPEAKTANNVALARALEMEGEGMHPGDIWKATGWGRGVDGQWRFEIPDQDAKLKLANLSWRPTPAPMDAQHGRSMGEGRLDEVLDHPELFAAYPHLKDVTFRYFPESAAKQRANFNWDGTDEFISVFPGSPDRRSSVLHEAQHAVQRAERFAPGSAVGMRYFDEDIQGLPHDQRLQLAYKRNWESAGEVEARNVQERKDWPDDMRRRVPPSGSEDVPRRNQRVQNPEAIGHAYEPGSGAAGGNAMAGMDEAWHGSPHEFDEFKLDKIGTGEGAQAYGHGLYFAGNPKVAESYKDTLKWQGTDWGNPQQSAAYWLEQYKGDRDKAVAYLEGITKQIRDYPKNYGPDAAAKNAEAIRLLKEGHALPGSKNPGQLYRVDLDVEPDDLLDWDKPLSQQNEKVRNALAGINPRLAASAEWRGKQLVMPHNGYVAAEVLERNGQFELYGQRGQLAGTYATADEARAAAERQLPSMDGQTIYRFLEGDKQTREAASQALREAGIPGIRYLDGGSRGPRSRFDVGSPRADFGPYSPYTSREQAEAQLALLRRHGFDDAEIREHQLRTDPDTHNYVIFDDGRVKILERNGQPLNAFAGE